MVPDTLQILTRVEPRFRVIFDVIDHTSEVHTVQVVVEQVLASGKDIWNLSSKSVVAELGAQTTRVPVRPLKLKCQSCPTSDFTPRSSPYGSPTNLSRVPAPSPLPRCESVQGTKGHKFTDLPASALG